MGKLYFSEVMVLKNILIAFSLLYSLLSNAATQVNGEIKYLGVNALNMQDGAAIGIGQVIESSCRAGNDPSVNYMVIDFTRPGMKEAYSLALAAYMSGTPVTISTSNDCFSNYELVKSIVVKR
ncbi:MAG: hypothetical protein ACFHVJ_05130 [Aestuariibacter sp.]